MSTLCRAEWQNVGQGNVRGARPSRSLCGASRAALPVKDVCGGTPNTGARDARAPNPIQPFRGHSVGPMDRGWWDNMTHVRRCFGTGQKGASLCNTIKVNQSESKRFEKRLKAEG